MFIQKNIHCNLIIKTDGYSLYSVANKNNNWFLFLVNHTQGFVLYGTHTNTIKNAWSFLKIKIEKKIGVLI